MREWILQFDFCSWCILAGSAWVVAHKVQQHLVDYSFKLRWIFGVAFLLTILFGYIGMRPNRGDELLSVLIAGFFFASLAELLGALILPAVESLWSRMDRSARERRREHERLLRAEREEEERRSDRERRALEEERLRPERERLERLQIERARTEAAAQLRRDEARSECLVFYLLHAAEIRERFPRKRYDEYVASYLRDAMSADEVERQASKLLAMMQAHLEKTGAVLKRADLASLGKWYQNSQAEIDAQPVTDKIKEYQRAKLRERYTEMTQEYLEGIQP